MTRRPTRREFVRTSALGGAALALGLGCDGEGIPVDDDDSAPAPQEPADGRVYLARAATPEEAVTRALELFGGLTFVEPGQSVLVKPNVCGRADPPYTTSPAVLCEVIHQCLAAGAGEVIVAERTWWGSDTAEIFEATHYEDDTRCLLDYIEEAGATFLPLDDEPTFKTWPEGADDFTEAMKLFQVIRDVDHVINVPALKTHILASFTMTMKNFFGLVHPDTRRGQVHHQPEASEDPDKIPRMMAQINLAYTPSLNVMDGIVACTTGGPSPGGLTAATDLIVAGHDRVAVDAVGLAILQLVGTEPHIEDRPVWDQVQMAEAVRLGVGVRGPDEVELFGDGVDELDEIDAKLRVT